MKHIIWADPKKEWEGFRLTAYRLDSEKVANLPLTEKRDAEGKVEKLPTTVGEIYKRLTDRRFEVDSHTIHIEIKTETETPTFTGPSFNLRVLEEVLKLSKEGASLFSTEWFWYDEDSCRKDAQNSYSFFVVCDDKIVRESVSFSDYSGNGFDPSVFDPGDDSDSIWSSDRSWKEARIRFWYRKFYTETRTGQLMVLRDDKSRLFDYLAHPGSNVAVLLSQNIVVLLKKIHVLLWVLIVLGGLILMRHLK